MSIESLSPYERESLVAVLKQALVEVGGNELSLFSSPLNYIEEQGRIKFNFPAWLNHMKIILLSRHDEKEAQGLILDILVELMKPGAVSKIIGARQPAQNIA